MAKAGTFFWYDLMTTDVPAAITFYKAVVGWTVEPFAGSSIGYNVVMAGDRGVGGIIPVQNAQQPASWLGYIKSADVDADAKAASAAGGKIWRGPEDIPGNVGRFAVISDIHDAPYMIMKPNGPESAHAEPMAAGTVAWSEHSGDDWEKAFAYYSGLYGWSKDEAIDMGEMGGVYQLISKDGAQFGAMMNRPPNVPVSSWGFYFAVDGIDAARERIVANGGEIVMEPMEVPGDSWALFAKDPQGAYFGLVSSAK